MRTMPKAVSPNIDLTGEAPRRLRLCSYVLLPFEAVLDELRGLRLHELAGPVISGALHRDVDDVVMHVSSVELIAQGIARTRFSWTTGAPGECGAAVLSILTVRHGRDALTELLMDVTAERSTGPRVADAIQRFLADLESRLTRTAATG